MNSTYYIEKHWNKFQWPRPHDALTNQSSQPFKWQTCLISHRIHIFQCLKFKILFSSLFHFLLFGRTPVGVSSHFKNLEIGILLQSKSKKQTYFSFFESNAANNMESNFVNAPDIFWIWFEYGKDKNNSNETNKKTAQRIWKWIWMLNAEWVGSIWNWNDFTNFVVVAIHFYIVKSKLFIKH